MTTSAPNPVVKQRSVLIAVGDPIARIGLETVLHGTDDCRPVGSIGAGDEVREAVERLEPDVVLLDIAFRREDESLIPDLAGTHPACRVLVLVDHGEDECALRYLLTRRTDPVPLSDEAVGLLDDCCLVSLRSKAWGCLPKGSDPERVLKAIRTVAAGEIAAAPWLAATLPREQQRRRPGERRARPITARELEVIALVADGLSNREVATALGIQEQTVKNHLGHIMTKLNVDSRLEIGLFAVKHHLAVRRPAEGEEETASDR